MITEAESYGRPRGQAHNRVVLVEAWVRCGCRLCCSELRGTIWAGVWVRKP